MYHRFLLSANVPQADNYSQMRRQVIFVSKWTDNKSGIFFQPFSKHTIHKANNRSHCLGMAKIFFFSSGKQSSLSFESLWQKYRSNGPRDKYGKHLSLQKTISAVNQTRDMKEAGQRNQKRDTKKHGLSFLFALKSEMGRLLCCCCCVPGERKEFF